MQHLDPSLESLASLETEQRNPRTMHLDALETSDLLTLLHSENAGVWSAVAAALPEVTALVEVVVDRLKRGGRLFYIGAGTSGRLGVLDASECPPTFGVPATLVQGIIAGGELALTLSVEGAEDDPASGANDLMARGVTDLDVVVGIAASGRTPYVLGALQAAQGIGAATAIVVNGSRPMLAEAADIVICAVTGPEALTGSTRLNAGTAQKLILNLVTTASMIRLGKTYSNLMVDVRATNAKLKDRAARIVMAASSVDRETAEYALEAAEGHVKTAIVMLAGNITRIEAEARLQASQGWVYTALLHTKGDITREPGHYRQGR